MADSFRTCIGDKSATLFYGSGIVQIPPTAKSVNQHVRWFCSTVLSSNLVHHIIDMHLLPNIDVLRMIYHMMYCVDLCCGETKGREEGGSSCGRVNFCSFWQRYEIIYTLEIEHGYKKWCFGTGKLLLNMAMSGIYVKFQRYLNIYSHERAQNIYIYNSPCWEIVGLNKSLWFTDLPLLI